SRTGRVADRLRIRDRKRHPQHFRRSGRSRRQPLRKAARSRSRREAEHCCRADPGRRSRRRDQRPAPAGGGTAMRWDDNLTAERPTFVTHLECSATGARYDPYQLYNLSDAGKPLLVRYDLDAIRGALSREGLAARPADMWRWWELLP